MVENHEILALEFSKEIFERITRIAALYHMTPEEFASLALSKVLLQEFECPSKEPSPPPD